MNLKCNWCDDKRIKEDKKNGSYNKDNTKLYRTIDKEHDSYIRDNKKHYYHENCYREKLSNDKKVKYTSDEIDVIISDFKVVMDEKLRKSIIRDKFYEWIKERYQVSLPPQFVLRVDSITDGKDTRKRVYGVITFDEFLEMYEKLADFMNKRTYGINFKNTSQRMNYELEIVLGQYENYKKFKHESKGREDTVKQVEEKIAESSKYKEVSTKVRDSNKEDFHIADIIEDIF